MKNNIILSYLKLSKVVLSLAVAFSAFVGYSLSKDVEIITLILLISGVFMLSSAASALNQIQEYKADLIMNRTKNRPIPAKNISKNSALIFSITLLIIGSLLLLKINLYCYLLGLLNVIIYNIIYTPLKYKSQFGLIAGGLVGAIPPVIGWAASGLVIFPSIVFFSVFMFLWQIPHFWILLIKYKHDYENAKIKSIVEVVESGKLKVILFLWIFATSLLAFSFPYFGIVSSIYSIVILVVINLFVILNFVEFLFYKKNISQFNFANIIVQVYLLFIFAIILVENI